MATGQQKRFVIVSADFSTILEDAYYAGTKSELAAMRGVSVDQIVEDVEVNPARLAVRDNGGSPEIYALAEKDPEELDPNLVLAVQKINDGEANPRILAFVFGHNQLGRVRKRIRPRPSDKEKRLKELSDKFASASPTAAELREVLRLLIGAAESG